MTAALAVVVPSRDRPRLLEGALASLAGLGPAVEVVVVDSASADAAAVAAVAAGAGARLVRVERPGTSRARNAGVAATTAPVIAFTDDDCRVGPGWAAAVLAAFTDDPALGFVTGGATADRQVRLPLSLLDDRRVVTFAAGADPFTCGHGANMAFRRETWDQVGGMDEQLGGGGRFRAAEDVDLFWRALRAGWTGRSEPAMGVVHVQWRTTGAALRTMYGYGIGSGAVAVKAIRLGDGDGRHMLRTALVERGALDAWHSVRAGWEAGALALVLKTVGTAVGAVRAARHPLAGDRYR
jgi:GT2 family glycosyltransferase